MYPHFVEVHDEDNSLITFSIDHIIWFNQDSVLMVDYDDGGFGFNVKESYSELKDLILNAGCAIVKADPRLDTSKPLTMEDLKGMIGEPVWNSNLMKWALIKEVREDFVTLVYQLADWVIAEDDYLAKYPLYRMRQG